MSSGSSSACYLQQDLRGGQEHSGTANCKKKVNYFRSMSQTWFQEIRHYMAFVFADKTCEGKDDWWQVLGGIDGLNENCKEVIQAGTIKVLDEMMSMYRPRTTKTGTLPYLSFIMRKPEPLGTKFQVDRLANRATMKTASTSIDIVDGACQRKPCLQMNDKELDQTTTNPTPDLI